MSPFWGEFIGTMLLVLMGDGVVAGVLLKHSKAEGAGWVVINLAWGLAVTLAVFAVGKISGAHLNPALTIALAADGSFPWADVPGYVLAQMAGAICGAALVWLHYLPHWSRTADQGLKLAVFCNAPAIRSTWANLLTETIGTFVLVLGLLFIGANSFAEGLNPLVVGALIVAIGASLGGPTGYAINPARDLGPRIAHALLPIAGKGRSDWSYAWIPVVGPILGALLGVAFYNAAFKLDCRPWTWVVYAVFVAVAMAAFLNERKNERSLR